MDPFLRTEALFIQLLLIASLVAIVVRRLRVPYTVALVVVGLLITYPETLRVQLTPGLILAVFVPALVFEAAFHIQLGQLRANLLPILLLAIPGVLLTTLIVGAIVAGVLQLPWSTGFVFGALISATDPVSVVALFRTLRAPRQLGVIIEGESLANDGTAIVVFQLMLAVALPGGGEAPTGPALDLLAAALDFVRLSAGGLALGLGLGWLAAQVIARLDDYLIETTLTVALAFGAYVLAETAHVSGVLAVVGAGLVNGNISPKGMSPTTQVVLFNFWHCLAFIANSLVFLLIGLEVNLPQIGESLGPIAVALLAVLVSRAVVVYGLGWLLSRSGRGLPRGYEHVLFWGGLRGAISLALVLSLPPTFAGRDMLRVMALGVVLFLILGQGMTMNWLLRRLGLVVHDEARQEYHRLLGRLLVARAARRRLEELRQEASILETAWEQERTEMDKQVREHLEALQSFLLAQPALRAQLLDDARAETRRAQQAQLGTLLHEGTIGEDVHNQLMREMDRQAEERPPVAKDSEAT
jgi:CPA1 family monovalent cation:H+ antiporter